ncbi:MAG: phospho-sugar mutase, partial [Candidatus Ventricola sp.]
MTYREQYEAWLRDFADDQATVAELKALEGNEKEIEDRFYTELSFGTAGMRGVLGAGTNRMNLYNVRRATKGFADYINSQSPEYARRGVVIAYDSRRMSPEFAKAAALVLCHEGINVCLFDELRPVPVLSYAVRHLHAIAGIVITASHNPPQYNGYKVYWEDGAQMP